MLDLTGGDGTDAPGEVPDLEDYADREDQKEDELKTDDLDQQEPTEEIDNLYTSNDGVFSKSHIVQQRYVNLFTLSPDAVTMFRDMGTYHELEERLRKIAAWEKLFEGGGRYRSMQDQVYTNENLRFLDDQLEELKNVPKAAQQEKKPKGIGQEEQKIDPGLIEQQADRFLTEFGPLLEDIPDPLVGTTISGDTPQFVERLDALFGGMIQHLLSEKYKNNPLARTLFTQYQTLVEGYEGAFRKLKDYKSKANLALAGSQEIRRRGIVKQLFSYDKEGRYKTGGKPDYKKFVMGLFTLYGKFEGQSTYDPAQPVPPPPKARAKPKAKAKPIAPKASPAVSEGRDMYNANAGPRGGLKLGEFLAQRFRFVFEQVAYSGTEYITNVHRRNDLERVFQKYNTPNPQGPPLKFGVPNTIYNWVTQFAQETDAGNARQLRGTRSQFEWMFSQMNLFQNEWRPAARGVNWGKIHRENPSPVKAAPPPKREDLGDEKSPPDPAFEQKPEATAIVAQLLKNNTAFQEDLVKFMWQDNTAQVLAEGGTQEVDALIVEFYAMWKNYFPSLSVTPADWPKDSVQNMRMKSTTYLDDTIFWRGARGVSRALIKAQKGLSNDDPSKVYPGQKTRRKAFLKFLTIIQNRQRYLTWAGIAKPAQQPAQPARERPEPLVQDLAGHMQGSLDDWLQDGVRDRNNYGPVGQKMNKARVDAAIALGNRLRQQKTPHFKIVEQISKFLGFRSPTKSHALLAKMLSDTGVGDGAPPRPWTWEQLDARYGESATYWSERLEEEFDERVAKKVAEYIAHNMEPGSFPKSKLEGTYWRSFRLNPAEKELFESGQAAHKQRRVKQERDEAAHAQRTAEAEQARLREEHEKQTDNRRASQERVRKLEKYQNDIAIYERKLYDPQSVREVGRKEHYNQEITNLIKAIERLGGVPKVKPRPGRADVSKISGPSGPAIPPPNPTNT